MQKPFFSSRVRFVSYDRWISRPVGATNDRSPTLKRGRKAELTEAASAAALARHGRRRGQSGEIGGQRQGRISPRSRRRTGAPCRSCGWCPSRGRRGRRRRSWRPSRREKRGKEKTKNDEKEEVVDGKFCSPCRVFFSPSLNLDLDLDLPTRLREFRRRAAAASLPSPATIHPKERERERERERREISGEKTEETGSGKFNTFSLYLSFETPRCCLFLYLPTELKKHPPFVSLFLSSLFRIRLSLLLNALNQASLSFSFCFLSLTSVPFV